MTDDDETMHVVREWAHAVSEALQLGDVPLDLDAVLAVAGLAARAAVRPAAPVTTYLVGYATGWAAAHAGGGDTQGPSRAPGAGATGAEAAFAAAVAGIRSLVAALPVHRDT